MSGLLTAECKTLLLIAILLALVHSSARLNYKPNATRRLQNVRNGTSSLQVSKKATVLLQRFEIRATRRSPKTN